MAQEARIGPRIAEGQRFPVDADRPVLQRADQLLGGVHQRPQVAAVVDPRPVGDGDEDFERRVAGARAHPGQRSVDPGDPVVERNHGVGDPEAQIVMGVDAELGLGLEPVAEGGEPVGDLAHEQRAARIGDVDALRAAGLHQPRLFDQLRRRDHVRHHQEPGHVHADLAGVFDVLPGDVGLGAVGGDPHRPRAGLVCIPEVVDGADAGDQQRRQPGVLDDVGRRLDIIQVRMRGEAVIERHPGQPVAVADLDGVDPRGVEGLADIPDPVEPVLVADGVHPVAQGHVLDVDLPGPAPGHRPSSARPAARRSTSRSAVLSAAEVMMSRLPA